MKDETKAILIGVATGILPLALNLLNIPPKNMFSDFDTATFLGNIVQVLILMFLGGFFVYIHKEKQPFKAFQLAIAAPAIVVSTMNGQALNRSETELRELSAPTEIISTPSEPGAFLDLFISSAHAQGESIEHKYLKEASYIDRFWYGISGNLDSPWFVIAGSHITEEKANSQVQELQQKGYDAKVYDRFGGSKYYGVMIGSYLTIAEAKQLRAKAIEDGLPKDTYLWKWK